MGRIGVYKVDKENSGVRDVDWTEPGWRGTARSVPNVHDAEVGDMIAQENRLGPAGAVKSNGSDVHGQRSDGWQSDEKGEYHENKVEGIHAYFLVRKEPIVDHLLLILPSAWTEECGCKRSVRLHCCDLRKETAVEDVHIYHTKQRQAPRLCANDLMRTTSKRRFPRRKGFGCASRITFE